jgi:hypothetical protein
MDRRASDALELMQEKVEEAEAQVARLKGAANLFAQTLGLEPPYVVESAAEQGRGGRRAVKPDQFASATAPSSAARAYFEWRGKEAGAATLEEVYEALAAGGFRFESRDKDSAKSGLRIALGKDIQIERLPNNYYGLSAWYGGKRDKPDVRGAKRTPGTSSPIVADELPSGVALMDARGVVPDDDETLGHTLSFNPGGARMDHQ